MEVEQMNFVTHLTINTVQYLYDYLNLSVKIWSNKFYRKISSANFI